MSWNPANDGEAPPDFLAALYGPDSEEQMLDEVDEELFEEYLDDEFTDAEDVELDASSPRRPSFSPLTSPERRGGRPPLSPEPYLQASPRARRSRSPERSPEPYLAASPRARRSRSPVRSPEPVDLANKWLKKPMCKAEVKSMGQQAVRHVIDIATKMSEDLKGGEREEVRNVITETEELLAQCSASYDNEKYSSGKQLTERGQMKTTKPMRRKKQRRETRWRRRRLRSDIDGTKMTISYRTWSSSKQ